MLDYVNYAVLLMPDQLHLFGAMTRSYVCISILPVTSVSIVIYISGFFQLKHTHLLNRYTLIGTPFPLNLSPDRVLVSTLFEINPVSTSAHPHMPL